MKSQFSIRKKLGEDAFPWELLLLADPSKQVLESYIHTADVYIAYDNTATVGVIVLTRISDSVVELKNIAVKEQCQGKGIGKLLVYHAMKEARKLGATYLEVGTGNSSISQLKFYTSLGFTKIGVKKDFFVRNYPEPIFENGVQCTDMIRLAMNLI